MSQPMIQPMGHPMGSPYGSTYGSNRILITPHRAWEACRMHKVALADFFFVGLNFEMFVGIPLFTSVVSLATLSFC